MVWTPVVGKSFSPGAFRLYVSGLSFPAWKPEFVVLHNTGSPNLAQRPAGLTAAHIANLQNYYENVQKWSAGPHLFVDDKQIWAFTPLTHPGVHSPSWNSVSWGIEMLGDYSAEPFLEGRGLNVRANAAAATAILLEKLGLPVDEGHLRLHHEDPLTTHRDCPGRNVTKADMLGQVSSFTATMPKL